MPQEVPDICRDAKKLLETAKKRLNDTFRRRDEARRELVRLQAETPADPERIQAQEQLVEKLTAQVPERREDVVNAQDLVNEVC
ncbi:hypothetical protein GCM10018793_05910 [Streptomyces sulfonofaciens]|uniref:Uncharacterized protein n=1 Tax=Streptomyces sulfonofaciens TaxID=68272 RepID=A0A919FRA1_9ACTN|nr:hypothetical protein [Streptomyces sulfonofaciens]GHH70970.1 hypothetical protein GCM10018793_05910 [Streptomyces sulfonofaciens]